MSNYKIVFYIQKDTALFALFRYLLPPASPRSRKRPQKCHPITAVSNATNVSQTTEIKNSKLDMNTNKNSKKQAKILQIDPQKTKKTFLTQGVKSSQKL